MQKKLHTLIVGMLWAGLWLCPARASAVLLDWNALTWSSGSLSATFYATNSANASTTSSRGIYYADNANSGAASITVTVSGDTSFLESGFPTIDNGLTGGQASSQDSLRLRADWDTDTRAITVTVTFNGYTAGVSNVSFSLFDIDTGTDSAHKDFVDQISSIYAQNGGTLIAPTITGSSANDVAGTGTNQTVTGNTDVDASSGNANASISYGTNVLTSFTFTYGNDLSAHNEPTVQNISLYDISFTPRPRVPEVQPAFAAIGLCGLAAGLRTLRRRALT